MNDTTFHNLLLKLTHHKKEYEKLLIEAEAEYEKRFGQIPSFLDDDYWIDTFHYSHVGYESFDDFKKIIQKAEANKSKK